MPFTLVDIVKIADLEKAREGLLGHVIPGVKQAPGFLRGTWSADREAGRGIGFIVFDTRENAESVKKFMETEAQLPEGVTLESATIYEVQGEA
jgi:hypothetical protein